MWVHHMACSSMAARKEGVWHITRASRPRMGIVSMPQDYNLNAAFMLLPTACQVHSLFVMALCLFSIMGLPLCSRVTSAPSSRERLALCPAWDLISAFHLHIHLPFNLLCSLLSHSLSVSLVAICPIPPAFLSMPRVRSRMSYRRGSSRGKISRHPSSTTLVSLSDASDFNFSSYPVTKSGRGKGRRQTTTEACSSHPQSHTACLRIPCSLSNSSIITSVIIELSEDFVGSKAEGSGAVGLSALMEMKTEDKNEATQRKDPGGPADQEANTRVGPIATVKGDSSRKEGQLSEPEDSDHFGR